MALSVVTRPFFFALIPASLGFNRFEKLSFPLFAPPEAALGFNRFWVGGRRRRRRLGLAASAAFRFNRYMYPLHIQVKTLTKGSRSPSSDSFPKPPTQSTKRKLGVFQSTSEAPTPSAGREQENPRRRRGSYFGKSAPKARLIFWEIRAEGAAHIFTFLRFWSSRDLVGL